MKPCNQCGKCCLAYSDGGLSATAAEVQWWETFRPDISAYVRDGSIWMDPASGEQLSRCPWLRDAGNDRYSCDIYHDRPEDCRHYPVHIEEMIRDECEMLELRDLTDPATAQRTLDKLMIDSRPPIQSSVLE